MFALDNKASGRRCWLAKVAGFIVAGMEGSALCAASRRSPRIPSEPRSSTTDFNQVISLALGGGAWKPSNSVRLEVPQLAENGAIVPITVESRLPNTRRILIFTEKKPGPLLAIVESAGHYYGVQISVRVMVDGCE